MSVTTLSLAAHNSRQTSVGSTASVACALAAGAALVAALIGQPAAAPRAAPLSTMPAVVVAPAPVLPIVAPPAAPVAAPPVVEPVQDGVSDRDGWSKDPAARVARLAPTPAPAPAVRVQDGVSDRDGWSKDPAARRTARPPVARVKVVPGTPEALKTPIARASARYGVPTEVLSAALAQESGNFKDEYIRGYHLDGSGRGLAAIDKNAHPDVSDAQAFDPAFSVDWMGRYLHTILKKNGGDVYSALREYNGGPNFASSRIGYQGRTVDELTRVHADKVMANAARAVVS